ncbi:tyrosinase family protein (plasmid) [Rhizobium sp. CB3171]|uniref:tyrosinase family protein n=1 Tax=Rhizobium sp. CB3171 TaxID=3039157 RepID=UPI0024B062E6|nr:tyrosinase family protein [Rhizobium sp. CB3171]WFU07265.1 tyrosinase family protein [Rhizobium sp. CB3171]
MTRTQFLTISRRSFVKGATAAAGTALFTPSILRAATKYRRKNMTSADGQKDLQSYMDAVAAMLKLPPSDQRNWYRNGFIHLMDCPHGDWWFTSWHRGYLGYFEETCRELSGNPDFALPYWDWTANPEVLPPLFGTILDPVNSSAYIPDCNSFQDIMQEPIKAYWDDLSPAQLEQQNLRGYPDFDALWNDAMASFANQPNARFLTAQHPKLNPATQVAVNIDTIKASLAPTIFANDVGSPTLAFNSPVSSSHQVAPVGFSILEGQPHNRVHMSVGGQKAPYGLMSQNLSPLDPIFFLHHCNIDRLWDVWTRKQQAMGLPIGPTAAQQGQYDPEPYLFYVNADGSPVADKIQAADYLAIGAFDYDYEAGSGEDVITVATARRSNPIPVLEATVAPSIAMAINEPAIAKLTVSQDLVDVAHKPSEQSRQFVRVSITPPMEVGGLNYLVFIFPEGTTPDLDPDGPQFAGSFEFFGVRHKHTGTVSFTIPIDKALDTLIKNGTLKAGEAIDFAVVVAQESKRVEGSMPAETQLTDIQVGSF